MIIKITTQRKNVRFLYDLISKHFLGFTTYKTVAFWQGRQEKSIVFEIDTLTPDVSGATNIKLRRIVKSICGYNKQHAVLIQTIKAESMMLDNSC